MTMTRAVSPAPQLLSRRSNDPWRHGEPDLGEIMNDPIVHLLMRRDGLRPDQVWPVVREAQGRLGRRLCPGIARAA